MSGVRDNMDREHLEQTRDSHGYEMIVERNRQMAAVKLKELRVGHGEMEDAKARGYLDALDACLKIPAILLEEFKAKR